MQRFRLVLSARANMEQEGMIVAYLVKDKILVETRHVQSAGSGKRFAAGQLVYVEPGREPSAIKTRCPNHVAHALSGGWRKVTIAELMKAVGK